MNVCQTAVTKAVNLAFFMVNFSDQLLRHFRYHYHHNFSILERKAFYRYIIGVRKYFYFPLI